MTDHNPQLPRWRPRRNAALRRLSPSIFVVSGAAVAAGQIFRMRRARRRISWSAPAGASHDGALHARTLGAGAHGVLLLHGLGGSNAYWGAAYDTVAGTGRLVAPDLLGFGRSPRPSSGYTATDHVEALTLLLAELGVTGPVIVAAHSFGCLVALALAEQQPDLIAGIVAFCPPLYPDEAAARTRVGSLGWLEHQLVSGGPWAQITCRWSCNHRRAAAVVASLIRPGWPAIIRRDGLQHTWTSYSQSFHEVLATAEAAQRLANIDVPVEFVAGLDDPVTDLTYLRVLAANQSHITLTICDGADHDLPLTEPSFAAAIVNRTAGLAGGPPGSG